MRRSRATRPYHAESGRLDAPPAARQIGSARPSVATAAPDDSSPIARTASFGRRTGSMPATAEKKKRKVHPPIGAAGEPNPLQAAAEARRKDGGTGTGATLSADALQ